MIAINNNHVHDRYLDAEERYEIFVVKAAERSHLLHWCADHSDVVCDKIIIDRDDDNNSDDDEKKVDHDMPSSSASTIQSSRKWRPPPPTNERLSQVHPPPLTDGCDLPGWRCQRIAPCMNSTQKRNSLVVDIESPLEGTLNIGAGSTLMRRESQFPFISSKVLCCGSGLNNKSHDEHDNHNCWWYSAKQRFDIPPSSDRDAPVINHDDAVTLVDYVTNSVVSDSGQRKITMFCREYEIKNRPVKIVGATEGWPAMPCYEICGDITDERQHYEEINHNWRDVGVTSELLSGGGKGGWTFANLLSRFGNVSFRFSDTHGEMMSLQTYTKYITNPEGLSDDSPLGIYDSEFGDDDSPTSVLVEEYSVPKCFSPDLFDFVDNDATTAVTNEETTERSGSVESDEESVEESNLAINIIPRPPYRWVLIGPERSGTGMHVDPLWTNAWVTILQGRKRWLLFPPDTPHVAIGVVDDKPQIPSSIWFRDFYDTVTSPSWPEEYKPVEVLQYPGETVYVPAGWPHLVLNLELTVAVTHNYASEHGPFFERMWKEVAQDEPDFAVAWYSGLEKCGRGDLTRVAPPEISGQVEFEEDRVNAMGISNHPSQ